MVFLNLFLNVQLVCLKKNTNKYNNTIKIIILHIKILLDYYYLSFQISNYKKISFFTFLIIKMNSI